MKSDTVDSLIIHYIKRDEYIMLINPLDGYKFKLDKLRDLKIGDKLDKRSLSRKDKYNITRLSNKYESVIKGKYTQKKFTNKITKKVLKNLGSNLVIADRIYYKKNTELTYRKRGNKITVKKSYPNKTSSTTSYTTKPQNLLQLQKRLNKTKLKKREAFQFLVNGRKVLMPMTANPFIEDNGIAGSLKDIIARGNNITFQIIKY